MLTAEGPVASIFNSQGALQQLTVQWLAKLPQVYMGLADMSTHYNSGHVVVSGQCHHFNFQQFPYFVKSQHVRATLHGKISPIVCKNIVIAVVAYFTAQNFVGSKLWQIQECKKISGANPTNNSSLFGLSYNIWRIKLWWIANCLPYPPKFCAVQQLPKPTANGCSTWRA